MTGKDWRTFRDAMALLGAQLIGFGISFVAQPPRVSLFVALLGLVLMLTLAPPHRWVHLTGLSCLMAGSVGLLSIASSWLRAVDIAEMQQHTPTESLIRGVLYMGLLAIGWIERRHRAIG